MCAVPVVALFAVVAAAPLPFSVAEPGITADVLGENKGKPVITLSGDAARDAAEAEGEGEGGGSGKGGGGKGQLRMTTIAATPPDATVRVSDVVKNWFATDHAVMPRDAVYPVGGNTEEIKKYNADEMKQSQDEAVKAALSQLHLSSDDVKVSLRLADVGGPSAGLLFSLGIVDKLDGDGSGGGLTGDRTVAGTGTIDASGKVGAVGGVPLKTQAAKRDGASVFLVPKAECADARAELPKGLRLVPVTSLDGAVEALKALKDGDQRRVPSC
ncbi:S16 family serine protease [Streptomyces sp. NPDC054796]